MYLLAYDEYISYSFRYFCRGPRKKITGIVVPLIPTKQDELCFIKIRSILDVILHRLIKEYGLKIAIGADHAGYVLKEYVKKYFSDTEISFKDYGTFTLDSCSYPEYGYKVSKVVISEEADLGILICGTGIGMSIVANKVKGIRAANANSEEMAQLSRQHNDANVLCLGGRIVGEEQAIKIIMKWLNTSFEGGRHQSRLEQISQLTGL